MRYYVYVIASESRTLYVGVTRDLHRRVFQHRWPATTRTFAARYRITKLVHYEETENIAAAIAREKQLKGWCRSRKIALIEQQNPSWSDLAIDWFQDGR